MLAASATSSVEHFTRIPQRAHHAGPEIGVASTKAFTAQLTVLALVATRVGELRAPWTHSFCTGSLVGLEGIPEKVDALLKKEDAIRKIAEAYKDAPNALFLGRGYNFPVALEGASSSRKSATSTLKATRQRR